MNALILPLGLAIHRRLDKRFENKGELAYWWRVLCTGSSTAADRGERAAAALLGILKREVNLHINRLARW